MKKITTLFLLILSCTFATYAKSTIPDEAIENATTVFNQLKRTLGLNENDPPYFKLVESLPGDQFVMAMIDYELDSILLEMTAYSLCKNVDAENALAFFLGHELAHYHSNHEMKNHYVRGFHEDMKGVAFKHVTSSHLPNVKKEVTKALFTSLTQETEREADLEGGFLAYMAGYKTLNIGERLLKGSYAIYGLDTAASNYPSLSERIRIVNNTEKQLEDLINYFETGNLLIAIGEYEDALLYYQKVLLNFKSREIYNNIGVLYALNFLNKVRQDKFRYNFPLELDLDSRLSSRDIPTNEELNEWLLKAIENFDHAIAKDENYPIAQLNRACVHLLRAMNAKPSLVQTEQFAIARAAALTSLVISGNDAARWKQTQSDAHVLIGILETEKGDKDKALTAYDQALAIMPGNLKATKNKQLLSSNSIAETQSRSVFPIASSKREVIDEQVHFRMDVDKSETLRNDKKKEVVYSVKVLNQSGFNSKVLFHEVIEDPKGAAKERFSIFHITDLDYPKDRTTAMGVKLGDDRAKIETAYQAKPNSVINLANGSWLVYRFKGQGRSMIFQMNTDGLLTRWCVYEKE